MLFVARSMTATQIQYTSIGPLRLSIHKPYGYGKFIWNFHMDMDRIDIWITYGHTEINLASGHNTTF
jgi:hypothetical protein